MELAVIGNEDFILGFRLLGIRKIYMTKGEEFEDKIECVLEDKDVGILVLRDDTLEKISPTMKERLRNSIRPVLITVGHEEDNLRFKIRRAIGIDLYSEKR